METDSNTGALPPPSAPPAVLGAGDQTDINQKLNGYKVEAKNARASGLNPRDGQWQQNLDLYWNRVDWTGKANWQAKETMPEVPSYVDRFAAAVKEALVGLPEGFYTIEDPVDENKDLSNAMKRLTDHWLSQCGRNFTGTPLGFPAVFEEECKLGALMAMCSVVTWKKDLPDGKGRVAVDPVDPRSVWLDHTGRNLYRLREIELDAIDLLKMVEQKSTRKVPLFDAGQISAALAAGMASPTADRTNQNRRELTGSGNEQVSNRHPFILTEWVATVIDGQGQLVEPEHALYNQIGDQYLIRGPEKNPYWHGKDWLVYAPLVVAPLSPYGRGYMDDFGSVAKTFTELTNLILDAIHTASMNVFAVVEEALNNPEALAGGIRPNLLLKVDSSYDPNKVLASIPLGSMNGSAFQVWQALKAELSEAAGINEIGLGQLPDKTHIASSAIQGAQQSSSAMIRSASQTIESFWLEPTLDLVWRTGMQYEDFTDRRVLAAIGQDNAQMFLSQRKQFATRNFSFQARGLTTMIQKQQILSELLQLIQALGQNQQIAQAFFQKIDMNQFINLIFNLAGIDPMKIGMSSRMQMVQSITQPLQALAAQQGAAPPSGMQQLAGQMGAAPPQIGGQG